MGSISMIRFLDLEFTVETNGSYVVGGFRIHKVNFTEFGQMEKALNWSNINAAEQNRVLEMIVEEEAQINEKLTMLLQQAKPEAKKRKVNIRDLLDAHKPRPVSMITSTGVDDPRVITPIRRKQAEYFRKLQEKKKKKIS
ncbi:hypothetical protein OWV82_015039 [Melia azedarach]|uniref:Uncharacterized protein n=1 Tax=Melia azedarach TaxID=155640 RepID=A0ACC1XPS5_MELAZ|nr:hypothetical protein OWV82_015039 [Melia azedarach]